MLQSKAEAQEVTIARAVQLKHKSSLIAALANDTKHFFEEADKQLAAIKNDEIVGKWRKYLQLKIAFYDSYTWCYQGAAELEKEECGTAVKCLQYARDQFIHCGKVCEQYKKQVFSICRYFEIRLFFRVALEILFIQIKRSSS